MHVACCLLGSCSLLVVIVCCSVLAECCLLFIADCRCSLSLVVCRFADVGCGCFVFVDCGCLIDCVCKLLSVVRC